MKLGALVLDYDGTIATDGVLAPGVRESILDARGRGVAVLLVTGRILADLQRVLPDLGMFDAVVAENGAVCFVPCTGDARALAPPIASTFLEELRRRGVPFLRGQCIVETDARHAQDVLAAVRDLELPLALLFNRGRLMVLPQSISKATGLEEACRTLRISLHNAVGIGDAENDHELLRACELGIAVAWGSAALRAVADEVLDGTGPAAVPGRMRALAASKRVPRSKRARRSIHLGIGPGGRPLALALRGRNVLIAGDPHSGKSWLAGLLCESLILQRYCVCVIDPEGDYGGLEALPGVLVLRPAQASSVVAEVEPLLRFPDVSTVVDLSCLAAHEKRTAVVDLLRRLKAVRSASGLPHRVVVDEAHYFLHDANSVELLDLELCGYTLITYRASELHHAVRESAEAILISRETDAAEAHALEPLCAPVEAQSDWTAVLAGLAVGEAALLPGADESCGELVRFRIARRLTAHVRHRHKYLGAAVEPHHAFVFTERDAPTGLVARSLQDLLDALEREPSERFHEHLRRGDLSSWIESVFSDRTLAGEVRAIEQEWRERAAPAVTARLARAIRTRYAIAPG